VLTDILQCGHPVCTEVGAFKQVYGIGRDGEKERAVQVAAGISFSLVLTESGKGMSHLFRCTSFSFGLMKAACSVLVWECRKRAVGERDDGGTYYDWQ
jgi:hypothetical protein